MKNKNLVLILYSVCFLPIWGILFLDPMTMSPWTVFLGLVYTSVSYDIVRKELLEEMPSKARLIVLSFPLLYLLISIGFMIFQPFHPFRLAHPILFGFLLLLASTHWLHGYFERKPTTVYKWGALLFFCYFYSVPLLSYWAYVM